VRLMGTIGQLREVEVQLIKDLEETFVPLWRLGEKYGVSKQAIFNFCQRKGIKRLKKQKREHTEHCKICQNLIRISKQHRSEFISSHTLKENLGLKRNDWIYHMGILREKRLIPENFGRMYSKKTELAFQIYFKERLPISVIGRKVGLNNFHVVLKRYKTSGWDVPAPLFIYDAKAKRTNLLKMMAKRKRKGKR